MHAGIYKPTKSTRVTSDADSMNGQYRERIENTSGFQVRTWLDAFSELEQYSGSDLWRISSSTWVHENRQERELRNGLCTKVSYDMLKSCWETGSLPVWQVWLAVTAKRFWIWKSCLTHVFSLVWRSGKFHEDWTEFVACGYVLVILTSFNMAAKFRLLN